MYEKMVDDEIEEQQGQNIDKKRREGIFNTMIRFFWDSQTKFK